MRRRILNYGTLLSELGGEQNDIAGYLTVYARPQFVPDYIFSSMLQAGFTSGDLREGVSDKYFLREAERLSTGAVILWSETYRKIILPPFPITENTFSIGRPFISPLQVLLDRERIYGIVLLAWGTYGIGVFRDSESLKYKTGSGHIHKRHKKGGSSQRRFARRIEEQKKFFLTRVAMHVEEIFQPYELERVFFGGNRLLLMPLMEESPYLSSKSDQISIRFIDVRHADRKTLFNKADEIDELVVFDFE
jgi:peptide subunit release factor 1 (eRF1)